MAYSSDYLVGVWLGRSDVNPMRGLTGGRAPATLARAILLRLHQNEPGVLQDREFPSPEGYLPVEICLHSDQRRDRCAQTLREWLPPGMLSDGKPAERPASAEPAKGKSPMPASPQETPVEITIVAPEHNARLWRNPETPPALDRIALKAIAKGSVSQIVWYVDDEPFGIAQIDQPLYWPLRKGAHQFQARLPYREERSHPVRVVVE